MTIYPIALFLHVLAALALGAALGIEWTGLVRLRTAATPESAMTWAGALRPLRRIGGPAMLTLLLSGGYMTGAVWGARPWISTALAALVVIAVLGAGISGRRFRTLGAALRENREHFDSDTRRLLTDPMLLLSLHLRTALLAGIILLMTVRPGWLGSAIILSASFGVGLVTGRRRSPGTESSIGGEMSLG